MMPSRMWQWLLLAVTVSLGSAAVRGNEGQQRQLQYGYDGINPWYPGPRPTTPGYPSATPGYPTPGFDPKPDYPTRPSYGKGKGGKGKGGCKSKKMKSKKMKGKGGKGKGGKGKSKKMKGKGVPRPPYYDYGNKGPYPDRGLGKKEEPPYDDNSGWDDYTEEVDDYTEEVDDYTEDPDCTDDYPEEDDYNDDYSMSYPSYPSGSGPMTPEPTGVPMTPEPTGVPMTFEPTPPDPDFGPEPSPSTPSEPSMPSPSTPSEPSPSTPSAPNPFIPPSMTTSPPTTSPSPTITASPTLSSAPTAPTGSPSESPTAPTGTPSETPTAPTGTPSETPTAPTASPAPTVTDPPTALTIEVDCAAVANGTAPTDAPGLNTYNVNLVLILDDGADYEKVANAFQGVLQTIVAPRIAGCSVPDPEVTLRRRLVETQIENVLFETPTQDPTGADECPETINPGTSCYPTDLLTDIYYYGPSEDFGPVIASSIEDASDLFQDIAGLSSVTVGDVDYIPPATDSPVVGGEDGTISDGSRGLDTGGKIGIAIGSTALLVFLLFFIGRRRIVRLVDDPKARHVDDDGSLLMEGTIGSDSDGHPTRAEGDSLDNSFITADLMAMEGLSLDRNQSESTLGGYHSGMDVHVCQSSTCEICAMRRENSTLFIKTGTPTSPKRPSLPADATSTREYVASDTVAL